MALTDLLGATVQVAFTTIGSSIQYIKADKLRPLAITTATRSNILPAVPPLADFLPGYEASSWNGLCAPKSTPAEIIDRLNREINTAFADPALRARFDDLGGPPIIASPADFARIIADDTEKWASVIKFSGTKAE
jgi:tripartite-type tricarboxylate transporter receptor subunit TctC